MPHTADPTLREVRRGYFFEGPRWHGNALWVSDFFAHEVVRIDDDSQLQVAVVPQQPSGLGFDAQGRLLVVSMLDRKLLRREPDGVLVEVADLSEVLDGPANDMVVDGSGRAYIGNFGSGPQGSDGTALPTRLALVQPDGTVGVAADDLVFPNGSVITPDGSTLVISETFASRLTAFSIAEDGTLSDRRVWAEFGPVGGRAVWVDGLALDTEGAIWVADAQGHGASRVVEGGEVVDFIDTGDLSVYAVALGGAARTTLYLCAAPAHNTFDPTAAPRGVLFATEVTVPGAGLP